MDLLEGVYALLEVDIIGRELGLHGIESRISLGAQHEQMLHEEVLGKRKD
jgi:hypothetical protein